jgi:hypothetical protein
MQRCELRRSSWKLINRCDKVRKVIWVDKCGICKREEKYLQNLVGRSKGKIKPLERHRSRWNLRLKWILKGKEKGVQWFK